MAMAAFDDVGSVRLLIEAGAHIEQSNQRGATALMAAALNGSLECIDTLLVAEADVNVRNRNGYTALMAAALNGSAACTRRLMRAGAQPDWVGGNGLTATQLAQTRPHQDRQRGPILDILSVPDFARTADVDPSSVYPRR